jgi:hypothetical protein
MFRHHQDPLYYDTAANPKIFVPVDPVSNLNDKQRDIVDSFPAEDRGEALEEAEYIKKGYGKTVQGDLTNIVELDHIEAAQKKHALKYK